LPTINKKRSFRPVSAGICPHRLKSDFLSLQAALVAAHKNEVWVIGGFDTDDPLATRVYSPAGKRWRLGPPLPFSMGWGAAAEVDGRLYIIGGGYHSHGHYIFHDRAFVLRD